MNGSPRILVIGANGQLGTELSAALADRYGAENVVASDRVKNWTIYLDKETRRIVRMDYGDRGITGAPVQAKESFEDYRQVGGIWWPYRHRLAHDDAPLANLTVSSVKVNTGVSADAFKKP